MKVDEKIEKHKRHSTMMKKAREGPAIEVDQMDTTTQAASADPAIALETQIGEPSLRRFATMNTVNDDYEQSSSSEDSFIDSSDDEDDLDLEEKMLQREIIKNFVAISKKKDKDKRFPSYSGEVSRDSTYAYARFSALAPARTESLTSIQHQRDDDHDWTNTTT